MSVAPPSRPAAAAVRWTVRQRAWWSLAALAPGTATTALFVDPTLPARVGAAILVAMAVDAVAARRRGSPGVDPASWVAAALVALVLPAGSPWWIAGSAAAVAVVAGRGVWTSASAAPFHPAMLAVAIVGLAIPTTDAGPVAAAPWPGLAWAAGAGALVALRVVRGAPAIAMLGAALAGLAVSAPNLGDAALAALADGRIVLVAGFVATAPASGALTPSGRWIVGAGIGLGAVFASPARPELALPYAVLLMNGLAPWVDHAIDAVRSRRPARSP